MSRPFLVDLLTPYRVVAKDVPAEQLLIPTVRGQINVLENHTHIVTKLDTGVLSVIGGADDPDRHFSITTGVCKVLNDRVTILSNVSEEMFEIDTDRAQAAYDLAHEKLASGNLTAEEVEKYRRKLERAGLRLQLGKMAEKK